MSVVAKRIGINSPREFNIFNIFYLASGIANVDASPIYSSFKMTVDISGTYSDATYDYAYSYSNNKTWTREEIRASSIVGNFTSVDINGISELPTGSYGNNRAVTDDYFTMGLFPAMDMTPNPYPMFVPKYPAAAFELGNNSRIETGAVIGTQTLILAPFTVTNITADISSGVPAFSYYSGTPTDPRFFVDGFECGAGGGGFNATISEDTTAWTAAKWRDFRGTYTATDTDANGITTDIELVLG